VAVACGASQRHAVSSVTSVAQCHWHVLAPWIHHLTAMNAQNRTESMHAAPMRGIGSSRPCTMLSPPLSGTVYSGKVAGIYAPLNFIVVAQHVCVYLWHPSLALGASPWWPSRLAQRGGDSRKTDCHRESPP
jgi:hypothetical protein